MYVLPFVVVLVLWSDGLVAFLFGEGFGAVGRIPALLAASFLVMSAGFASSRGLFALGRAKGEFLTNLAGIAVWRTIGTWMIWRYGVVGGAYGFLAANLVSTGFRNYLFRAVRLRHEVQGS